MPNVVTVRGTIQTLLSTELNALANNTNAVHATSITLTNPNYLNAELELVVQFGVAPTLNTAVLVWLLREVDGTNFEDGGSVTPLRMPDAAFPLRNVTTSQRIIIPVVLPPGATIKPMVRNDGSGQAFSATGHTLKLRAFTDSI